MAEINKSSMKIHHWQQMMEESNLAVDGKDIFFSYGTRNKVHALNGLDINVEMGSIYGLLGPSGCGKTTLLRCLTGQLKPKLGKISIFGRTPGESGFCIPGRGLGYMPQELGLAPQLSIEEFLLYFGRIFHSIQVQLDDRISFLVKLLNLPDKKSIIENLSGGQKRRVSFAAALIHKPPLLIMDEPTVGLDPVLRQNIWEHLKLLSMKDNMTILVTTHYVEEVNQAHKVGFMRRGHLLVESDPQLLMKIYGALTLEEVFFKLSVTDSEYGKQTTLSKEHLIASPKLSNKNIRNSLYNRKLNNHYNLDDKGLPVLSEMSESEKLKIHNRINISVKFKNCTSVLSRSETKAEKWKMKLARCNALIRKSFTYLNRSKMGTMYQMFFSIVYTLIYCNVFGQNFTELPVAVMNLDTNHRISNTFLSHLDRKMIKQIPYTNLTLATDSVRNKETYGVLYIGSNFTSTLIERYVLSQNVQNETIWGSSVKLHLDATGGLLATSVYLSVLFSFQNFTRNILQLFHVNPALVENPVQIVSPVYGAFDFSYLKNSSPNFFIVACFLLGAGLASIEFMNERSEGLTERSIVSGVGIFEMMLATLVKTSVFLAVQIIFTFIIGFSIFTKFSEGSLISIFICEMLAGITGISFGCFLSSICDSKEGASVVYISLFSPCVITTGCFWTLESMPYYLRLFNNILPLSLLAETTSSVYFRGFGILDHYNVYGILVPIIWTVLLFAIARIILNFKY